MLRNTDVLALARELDGLDDLTARLVVRELGGTHRAALGHLERLWRRGLIEPASRKPRPPRYKHRPWWREPWHTYSFRLTATGRARLDFLRANATR